MLSGGGARGFAHLGVIRALREARVPIDFVGGSSIGSIIAAGVAVGWSDEEMRMRYRRSFVDTNPVNDYTFPFVALTRGRKVSRLLQREYGDVLIEDLRRPFFCVSANLTTGRALEHREGRSPMRCAPRSPFRASCRRCFAAMTYWSTAPPSTTCRSIHAGPCAGPRDRQRCGRGPLRLGSRGKRRINIFQILMHAGMVNSASSAGAQRELADVLLKPPLANIDLLNWHAFDRAIQAGYEYARAALEALPAIPRLPPAAPTRSRDAATPWPSRLETPPGRHAQ